LILELAASSITPTLKKPSSPDDFDRWDKEFTSYMKPYNNLVDKLLDCNYYDFGSRMFMDVGIVGSEKFYYFLDNAKELNGHKLYFYPMLEKKENDYINAYIMRGAKDFPLTYDCSKLSSDEDVSFFNPSDEYPIKIMKELRLKTFKKIRDDRIYEDSNGFIISAELAKKFTEVSLSGYELTPVKDCKSKNNHENMYCLTAMNILQPSEKNIFQYEGRNFYTGEKTLPYEGTMIYKEKALEKIKDFNYPCEATHRETSRTDMIVSKKFKEFCEQENIKGVDFIPVFIKDCDLYYEYIELVTNLCKELIESNPKHKIGYAKINPCDILEKL